MRRRWYAAIFLGVVAVLLLGLWLARTYIAVQFARSYFHNHGVTSSVEISELGFSGVSARFTLGTENAPEFSAERIELYFDSLRWMPYVTEVRLVNPLARARIDETGNVTLGSLQDWIDSLRRQQGKSQFVSDNLTVSLTGLRLLLATPGGPAELDGDIRLEKIFPSPFPCGRGRAIWSIAAHQWQCARQIWSMTRRPKPPRLISSARSKQPWLRRKMSICKRMRQS